MSFGKALLIVIVVVCVAAVTVVLIGESRADKAQAESELNAAEKIAQLDPSTLPVISIGESGEAVTAYGAYEVDQIGRYYANEISNAYEAGIDAIVEVNAEDNETIRKNQRNSSWSSAVIMAAAALIILALVVYGLLKDSKS